MAEESCRKRLRDEGSCSVCLDYFRDPVTLDCGHNFCRACIAKSWRLSPTEATCPRCRERVKVKKLRPNRQLANMVQIAKDLSDLLKHRVVSVEETAQECKDQISRSLSILRKERENILVYKVESEKESQDLLKQTEAEREKIATAFRQLHQFLEEQEKLLLAQMEEVVKDIAKEREEHLARLSGELSSFDSLIRELEEKQQQSENELLQNLGDLLERCQKECFENPGAFPASLKWRIHDVCDISPFLEGIMKQFKDSLVSGLQLQEAKVTLDPDTAHPNLILSEDHKSVRCGDEWQDLPGNPKRFESSQVVLGREGFTAGRHFWEVTVGSEGEWSVGVVRKTVKRKDSVEHRPETGFWDTGMWNGEYRFSVSPRDHPLCLSQELKIRVTLNYAGGRVAFFNANTGAQLYVFSDASFCGKTLLPFFWVSEGGYLTLCT
ncbi:zinc finger protein RFP-like [Tiliqua scincoides]|uniref:zinc finger protein RFP-like n=1 Tax=Tiliqua scincoides TaxID=71010 RepID=UPI00346346C3